MANSDGKCLLVLASVINLVRSGSVCLSRSNLSLHIT